MPRTRFNNGVLGPRQTTTATTAAGVFGLVDHQVLTGGGVFPRSPSNLGIPRDVYFNYVSALLPGNGTNGAQNNTFLDASSNNFTITREGNSTQGTFSPYGDNWSNYFDGSGDYISMASNAAFNFDTGNFTVEFWSFPITLSARCDPIGRYNGASSGWGIGFSLSNAGDVFFYYGNSVVGISAGGAILAGTWNHVAVTRSGSAFKIFVNGVSVVSVTDSTNMSAGGTLYTGATGDASGNPQLLFTGYLSNVRIVKGSAVYTDAFTPPAAPLTAIANTSLLTCQSNRFVDNSANAFAITVAGNTNVQRFSPFAPTGYYSTATIGGSGYFDGSADRIQIANTTELDLGTGNFTVECWVYSTKALSSYTLEYAHILGKGNGNGAGTYALAFYQSKIYFAGIPLQGATTLYAGTWYHFAATRSGSTFRLFVNGVQDASTTNSTDFTSSESFNIGDRRTSDPSANYPFNGYVTDVRVIKGTAQYTSNFTPPTAPLTAVTNTKLLTNFTNAGIIDNAMQNNFETIGQAQISTTQSKFGGSSMYFDGTDDRIVTDAKAVTFGTGDFTIEFWTYLTESGGAEVLIDTASSGYAGELSIRTDYIDSSRSVYVTVGGISFTATYTAATVLLNNWRHWALVRSGTASNNVKLYLDGTSIGQGTTTASITISTNIFAIGGAPGPTSGYTNTTGYIDDFRITRGIARYTANFTPPTSAFILG
jgi:hypothetical protein